MTATGCFSSIKRGEHKRHGSTKTATATIYDDDYDYSIDFWLDVYCF